MEIEVNDAIIVAALTVIVSAILFIIKELVLVTRREKRTSQRQAIEKRLEAYGNLSLILHATKQKAKRQNVGKNTGNSHLLEYFDAERFRRIFSEKRHLLSARIVDEYLDLERKDEYFGLGKEGKNMLCDLSKMEDYADSEYEVLREEFEKLTDYKL